MSDPPTEPTDQSSVQSRTPGTGRRRLLAAIGGLGATLLAGCAGKGTTGGPNGSSETQEQTGEFRLLISDRPGAIEDFDSLTVTFDRGRIFHADTEEDGAGSTPTSEPTDANETTTGTSNETSTGTSNETTTGTSNETTTGTDNTTETDSPTDEETTSTDNTTGTEGTSTPTDALEGDQKGWSIIDLSGESVDLTDLAGEKAKPIFEGELPAGRYTKFELYVAEVEGIVDGEEVDVKVPSGKLQLTKPFEVDETGTTSFVFDIQVVEKGSGGYNLRPVVSESGVAGEEVTVTEVQTTTGGNETTGNETGTTEETPTTTENETTTTNSTG